MVSLLLQVVFLERKLKRRILNMREALATCGGWKPPAHSGFTHTECGVLNVDDSRHWKIILAIMGTVDVMVSSSWEICLPEPQTVQQAQQSLL